MADASESIIIDAHPAQVWPFLFATKEKMLGWQHKTGAYSSIEDAHINIVNDPDGNKVGAITCQTTDGREVTMNLVDYNEPRWIEFSYQYVVSPLVVEQYLSFELEPEQEKDKPGVKTKLTLSTEWYLNGANLPFRFLAGWGTKKRFYEMVFFTLKNIKELVEKNIITSNEEAVYADIDD